MIFEPIESPILVHKYWGDRDKTTDQNPIFDYSLEAWHSSILVPPDLELQEASRLPTRRSETSTKAALGLPSQGIFNGNFIRH